MSRSIDNLTQSEKIRTLHDWINHMDEYAQDDLLIEFLGFEGVLTSTPTKTKEVFIVIDQESSGEDAVYDVCFNITTAEESQEALNNMRVGGAITTIIQHNIT